MKKRLVLHIEVEGFHADDLDELAGVISDPGPPTAEDRLYIVTEEWVRPDVGLTLVTIPGDKCMNDDFEVVAFTGRIVGAESNPYGKEGGAVSEPRYGAKCLNCQCVEHRGSARAVPTIPWLPVLQYGECADCLDCQERALVRAMAAHGADLFDPAVREVVRKFRNGQPLDSTWDGLRIECQALEATVDIGGRRWRVVDAQRDMAETSEHLHLTLVPAPVNVGREEPRG